MQSYAKLLLAHGCIVCDEGAKMFQMKEEKINLTGTTRTTTIIIIMNIIIIIIMKSVKS